MSSVDLLHLTHACGISTEYLDAADVLVTIPESDRVDVLNTIVPDLSERGVSAALKSLEWEKKHRLLPPVCIARSGQTLEFRLNIPASFDPAELKWRIQLEKGEFLDGLLHCREFETDPSGVDGSYQQLLAAIDATLPEGYHQLEIVGVDEPGSSQMPLIVVPAQCYQQPPLLDNRKLFGFSMQLYSARSSRNWGMGDFTDLKNFVRRAATEGVDIVGLNPLHALFPANPLAFSPYSPSNRAFVNVMYIDPQAVAEYDDCDEAKALVESDAFQARLTELRAKDDVDYSWVAQCKFRVLKILFTDFEANHLPRNSARAIAYRKFVEEQGSALQSHAIYDALHEYFLNQDEGMWGWPVWPEEYRDPHSTEVENFAAVHRDKVEYFKYLQWCAFDQLEAAQQEALDGGMAIGIYLDLAVGNNAGGSEAWANQELFCFGANSGAPPDELATQGQDWGFPPFEPRALRANAYDLFARNLRANMRCAGGVRFDHCVSLMRLWWIPAGKSAREGAYVNYRIDELTGVLALESHRNRCMVIGEDLGTVPEQLPKFMDETAIYCYRVLYFEMEHEKLVPPECFPERALVTITTHDLSPLASWWELSDLDLRQKLDILDDPQVVEQLRREREHEKQLLLNALHHYGYLEHFKRTDEVPEMTREINEAVHLFLASSRAAIMISQLEDWMDMHSPVNVPGTDLEYNNWQRKMDQSNDDFFDREENTSLLNRIAQVRSQAGVN